MKFKIVYDKPCRIRFRCGGYAFDRTLEYSIYKKITSADFVTEAEIRSGNGGILVYYKDGFRKNVIDIIAGLDIKNLEILSADPEYVISETDRDFKNKILINTAKKLFSKE